MAPPFPHQRTTCIACGHADLQPVMWIRKTGEPPGSPDHNIVYEYNTVAACPTCSQAQMEELSHDCWSAPGEEDWDMYWWYLFDSEELILLRNLLAACPAPLDPACTCSLHQDLRKSCEGLFSTVGYSNRLPHRPSPRLDTRFLPMIIEKRAEHFILLPVV